MARSRFPWLDFRLKKSAPEPPLVLPVQLDSWSNGEAFFPTNRRLQRMKQRILEKADDNAKRIGWGRREFLASTMGMATSMLVMGCSDDEGNEAQGGPDGGNSSCAKIPQDAQFDEDLACSVLGPSKNEFIFDIQTHHYVDPGAGQGWRATNVVYEVFFNAVGWFALTRDAYIRRIFLESDTSMAVLSGLPSPVCTDDVLENCGPPIPNEEIAATRDTVNMMANSLRMLNHVMVVPNVAKRDDPLFEKKIQDQLAHMEAMACSVGVSGWKLYPAAVGITGEGYFLDEEPFGLPVIEKALSLGVNVFCIHKGLPIGTFFDTVHNQTRDVGPVAKRFPQAKFVIYHSGIFAGIEPTGFGFPMYEEAPYDSSNPDPKSVDQLIRTLEQNELGPQFDPNWDPEKGLNVYGELGTAWQQAFSRGPEFAGHFMGKLLKYLGEDNVCWGTDAMNSPGPQSAIENMRGFQIPQNLVDDHGYPQLTDEVKAKIFGLNSAKVFGVDVEARRCAIEGEETAQLKRLLDDEIGTRRHALNQPVTPTTVEEFIAHSEKHKGWPT